MHARWSKWRPFPDPRKAELLVAPIGPGCCELRHRAQGVLFGRGNNVAYRMSSLLPSPHGCGTRNNSEKRDYVLEHGAEVEYRTLACNSPEDAGVAEQELMKDRSSYLFRRWHREVPMAKYNEGKCLDAVLKILEVRHNALRRDLERDKPESRGIELVCKVGDQRYALEHTLIEPFPNNQRDNIAFERVFDDAFEREVRDQLKSDLAYTLAVDVYAFDGKNRKDLAEVRQCLIAWVRASVPKLSEPEGYRQSAVYGEPPSAPVRVRLACHRSKALSGRLMPERFAPPGLEQLRDQRLSKALNDKGPKLRAAKLPGTRTVLILENADIALTNESGVADAIDRLGQNFSYMPDDIYLVGTYTTGHFYVTQLREHGHACLKMGDGNEFWEFEADALTDI